MRSGPLLFRIPVLMKAGGGEFREKRTFCECREKRFNQNAKDVSERRNKKLFPGWVRYLMKKTMK